MGARSSGAPLKPPRVQFADMDWQSRWNGAGSVGAMTQSGARVYAVSFMGVVRFRLDQDEDVAAIVNGARQFADMVEKAKKEYDGVSDS
jgi:hypothetical protein